MISGLLDPLQSQPSLGGHELQAAAWQPIGSGWAPLCPGFDQHGFSIEWHDFRPARDLDWARSFRPLSLEICFNLSGSGQVSASGDALTLAPLTCGFYLQSEPQLRALRPAGEHHRFLTIEYDLNFLLRHLPDNGAGLNERLQKAFGRRRNSIVGVSCPQPLTCDLQQLLLALRHPPVPAQARHLWYQAKALEAASALLYQPHAERELFCPRQKQLNTERVRKTCALLQSSLAAPPTLQALGQQVGCSPFYLSRLFSREMGQTISAYLHNLRMEQAAHLLRQGRFNVTEVALEVGYNSCSHFSQAFHKHFGCCPGLYPLATPAQQHTASTRSSPPAGRA